MSRIFPRKFFQHKKLNFFELSKELNVEEMNGVEKYNTKDITSDQILNMYLLIHNKHIT